MSDKQRQQFIKDRAAEILYFVEVSYKEHKTRCSIDDWQQVLNRVIETLRTGGRIDG